MSVSARIREHLRSNVWGIAALVVALTGTAWAGAKIGSGEINRDAIRSKHIRAEHVRAGDLDRAAVTEAKLADEAVTGAKVADEALTGADLDEGSLGPVPAAVTATDAAHAASATDAQTLGGLGPGAFLRGERFETSVAKSSDISDPDPGLECVLGELRLFAGNFAPANHMFAHGQTLPIAQNTALFAILGTTYGGDGRTTFALPDTYGLGPDGTNWVICTEGIFPPRA